MRVEIEGFGKEPSGEHERRLKEREVEVKSWTRASGPSETRE